MWRSVRPWALNSRWVAARGTRLERALFRAQSGACQHRSTARRGRPLRLLQVSGTAGATPVRESPISRSACVHPRQGTAGCQAMADGSAVVCGLLRQRGGSGLFEVGAATPPGALCSLRSPAPCGRLRRRSRREGTTGPPSVAFGTLPGDHWPLLGALGLSVIPSPSATMAPFPRFAPPGCNALLVEGTPSLRAWILWCCERPQEAG